MLAILCGKSSCGKDTLVKILKKRGFSPIVSTTTRPMRDGEEEGREYYFISREEFLERLNAGKMLEYRAYDTLVGGVPDTWYYGNEYKELDDDKDYVTILDLEGAEAFHRAYGNQCVIIYIGADDEKRTEWARSRGSFDEQEWNRRLKADAKDFKPSMIAKVCNYTIENTSDVKHLLGKFMEVFCAAKEERRKGG